MITRRDSVLLRGEMEPYTDEQKSDGNIGDIRLAVAGHPTKALAIGGALHLLTGSTQEEVRRRWDDSVTYRNTYELEDVQYNGFGASASALLAVSPRLRVAGWARLDTRLTTKARGQEVNDTDLPVQAAGAVEWHPLPALRVAGAVRWAGWSVAPLGHDTFGWSVGGEVGSPSLPLRVLSHSSSASMIILRFNDREICSMNVLVSICSRRKAMRRSITIANANTEHSRIGHMIGPPFCMISHISNLLYFFFNCIVFLIRAAFSRAKPASCNWPPFWNDADFW